MEKNNNALLTTLIVVAVILSLITMFAALNISVDKDEISKEVAAQVRAEIDKMPVPLTAEEVAALVPEFAVPEFNYPEVPEFKGEERVNDLWEDLYGEEIDELEAEAYDIAELELEDDEYELLTEWLEANIEGFDELEDVDVEDSEVEVVELGLEEDEDKSAEVVFELEVEYTLAEGVVQVYKKKVLVQANVLFEEGDFEDEDVELVFA